MSVDTGPDAYARAASPYHDIGPSARGAARCRADARQIITLAKIAAEVSSPRCASYDPARAERILHDIARLAAGTDAKAVAMAGGGAA